MASLSTASARALRPERVLERSACLAAFVLCLLLAPRAEAQSGSTVTSRVVLFTGAGFGGQAEVTYDGSFVTFSTTSDLASTALVGARYEAVFLRYLAFGGQLRASFWRVADGSDRNPLVDLAATPRLRYPIVLGSSFMVEPYVVVPVGMSIAIWNASNTPPSSTGLDRVNPALTVGALAGVTLLSRSGVGGLFEFGWMHHVGYDRDQADARYTLKLNQATMHFGLVYAF